MVEREPRKEIIQRGELYFLSHPGTAEIFSGYGLTTQEGRKDQLVGLLMVDRPRPVDPAWLAQIEETYGECELVPMTATGERGLSAQMKIEQESLLHLCSLPHPRSTEIEQAIKPLLDDPPNPILKLAWDEELRFWTSCLWRGLPPELQQVFERTGYGCLAVEREDLVSFVTHAPNQDIESFRGSRVLYHWELIEMPTAPLIRFRGLILDDPQSPYLLEHFLNVAAPDQTRCLVQLVDQEEIAFDFFGDEYEYAYSKHLVHPQRMRQQLRDFVTRAADYWANLPEETRDFDLAKEQFQRHFPP